MNARPAFCNGISWTKQLTTWAMDRREAVRAAIRVVLLTLIPAAGLWYAEARRADASLPLGHRLPPIVLEYLTGIRIDPKAPDRPTAVVVFTASCPFCRVQLERCKRLAEQFRGIVDVLAVSLSDHAATRSLIAGSAQAFSIASCADTQVWSEWRIARVPSVFLLNRRGILVAQWSGVKPEDEELRLFSQLASSEPSAR
jgi:peroxiredoxin